MRTFIALEDIERAADALAQAQRYGYTADRRDWFYLAEGYLARGARLAAVKELDSLTRAAEAYTPRDRAVRQGCRLSQHRAAAARRAAAAAAGRRRPPGACPRRAGRRWPGGAA